MPELWILATLTAALVQAGRFALQKRLQQAGLGTVGATAARFVWGAPLLVAGLGALVLAGDLALPRPGAGFWPWAVLGALGQILATIWVLALFRQRHFAVGVTLKKSEVLLTAALGWAVLGDTLGPLALGAMAVGAGALVLLSAPAGGWRPAPRVLALGFGSGLAFAVAGVAYRGAVLALGTGPVGLRAATALALVTLMQAGAMLLWMGLRDRAALHALAATWRTGLSVGALSVLGSLCWFTAFGLNSAAMVYALGQVELIFAMILGGRLFGERPGARDTAGIALLGLSLVALVLA